MQRFRGPHGYDPGPVLASLQVPSLWILGGRDRSIPLGRTVSILDDLRAQGRPITTHVIPDVYHSLKTADGRQPHFWAAIQSWLGARGVL